MKAEKLPSGNWRVRIYVGRVGGKPKTKSITARTKQEVLKEAAKYELKADMSVQDACERYIDLRENELSPSTVRGYKGTLETQIKTNKIGAVKLSKLTSEKIQQWITDMDVSPKSKRNHYGLLLAAVRFFEVDKVFRVRIARTDEKEMYTPTIDEVNKVIACSDDELKRAICLACFGLRRGEICALTAKDIDRTNCTVSVTKAYAKGPDGFVVKAPKTKKSNRIVPITKDVIDILPDYGKIIDCSPDCITNRFAKAVETAGVPHFRFHDLRSFFASISLSSAIGAGSKTVQDLGGWETDRVLKTHYERSITDQKKRDTDAIIHYFKTNIKIVE